MKRIEDLGENECVSLPTRKKALKFLNFIGKPELINEWHNAEYYYHPKENYFSHTYPLDGRIYILKEFLPKKQSLKKRLSIVESEVRRLNDLYWNNAEVSISKETIRELTEPAPKEIDWSIAGQIVEREHKGFNQVLETTGLHSGFVFSGVVKERYENSRFKHEVGYCGNDWLKSLFKLKN